MSSVMENTSISTKTDIASMSATNSQMITPTSTIDKSDTTWVLISACLVFIMIPGVGYFYGGMIRRKNQLTLLISTGLGIAVVSFQWFLWGYSLSFSQTGSSFIGNFDNAVLINVSNNTHMNAPSIPANVYMIFQCMFAAITPCLAFGSAAERTTMPAYLIFLFVWSTIVYDFIAYWTWAPNGWLRTYGVLDFAGGTPVHITSGFSAFAYALAVGPRKTIDPKKSKPSNISDVFLGTVLLWFGWFGFNGGSECAINARAVNAVIVSNLAACVSGLSWMITEMIERRSRKLSLNGFSCGAIAGLVTITPASGFVSPQYSLVIGFLAGIICCLSCHLKKLTKYKYDDACDVFAVHGVGGVIGCILTGIFAQNNVVTLSGDIPTTKGGWLDGNYIQLGYQLISVAVASTWSFVLTFIILFLIDLLPCVRLKLTPAEEELGTDWVELGEVAFGHDINESDINLKWPDDEEKRSKRNFLGIIRNLILNLFRNRQ